MTLSLTKFPNIGINLRSIAAASVLAFCALPAAAQAVTSELAVFSVETSDEGSEVLSPADSIDPGETLQYVVTYKNNTNNALGGFVVTGPVPVETSFDPASSYISQAAEFQARTGDVDWAQPPLFRMVTNELGERVREEVPASDYAEVRWVLSEALPPQSTLVAQYRTTVNQ